MRPEASRLLEFEFDVKEMLVVLFPGFSLIINAQ